MADEREVVARLKVERTGDEGAFTEAAGEIRELDTTAKASQGGLESLADNEKTAGDAATEMGNDIAGAGRQAQTAEGQIDKVGDAAQGAGEKAKEGAGGLLDFQTRLVVAGAALNTALAALDEVEGGLNKISKALGGTGKEFDLFSNPIEFAAESIVKLIGKMGNLGEAFQAFENAPGSVADKLIAAKKAFDGFDADTEKFRDSIRGVNDELNSEVDALAEAVASLEATGSVHEAEAARIKSSLETIAEKAKRMGADLPAAYDPLVEKYGEVAAASEELGTSVEEGATAIKQAAGEEARALGGVAAAQADATAKIQAGSAAQQSATQATGAAKIVFDAQTNTLKTLGDTAKGAGEAIAQAGDKVGDGAKGLADTGKAATEAGAGLGSAKQGASGLGEAAGTAAVGVGTLASDLAKVSPAANPVAASLKSIETSAAALNGIKLDGFVAALKAVEIQALATKAAVDAIDGASPSSPTGAA